MKILLSLILAALMISGCGPSTEELEDVASMGKTQKNAAVNAEVVEMVVAPVQMVWLRTLKIESWPGWNAAIEATTAPEEMKEGATFSWTADGSKRDAKIVVIRPGKLFAWVDETTMTKSIVVFKLDYVDAERTILQISRSLDGPFVSLFTDKEEQQACLQNWVASIRTSLNDTKVEQE